MSFSKYYVGFLVVVAAQALWLSLQGVSVLACGVIGFLSGIIYSIGQSRGEN